MTPKEKKAMKRVEQEFLMAARNDREKTLADYYRKKESIMYKQQTISQCEKEKQ
jgi:hypothetical protein